MVPAGGSTDDFNGLGLNRDTSGVWYHNYVWAGLDSGALYEIYWYYNPHIVNAPAYDHRPEGIPYYNFLTTAITGMRQPRLQALCCAWWDKKT